MKREVAKKSQVPKLKSNNGYIKACGDYRASKKSSVSPDNEDKIGFRIILDRSHVLGEDFVFHSELFEGGKDILFQELLCDEVWVQF